MLFPTSRTRPKPRNCSTLASIGNSYVCPASSEERGEADRYFPVRQTRIRHRSPSRISCRISDTPRHRRAPDFAQPWKARAAALCRIPNDWQSVTRSASGSRKRRLYTGTPVLGLLRRSTGQLLGSSFDRVRERHIKLCFVYDYTDERLALKHCSKHSRMLVFSGGLDRITTP